MKRVQLYLDSGTIVGIDQIERITNLPRSKIIREMLGRATDSALQFLQSLIFLNNPKKQKYTAFDKYIGAIDVAPKKKLDIKREDEDIYSSD